MPWYAFDVTQGCHHEEAFTSWIDTAGFHYVEVSRDAFEQVKRGFRKRWCRMCTNRRAAANIAARRTSTRRNVRADDTGG